ncbi:MAG: hypothetical protein AAB362_03485 [Patescibacteria group bacterium]
MALETWGDVVFVSLQTTWGAVAGFVPLLLGAIIVFVIGWIIAVSLEKVIEQVVRSIKLDSILEKLEVGKIVEHAGMHLNSGAFFGGLIKWFLIVVSLLAAANILGLTQVSVFLSDILLYVPNVVVASLILVIALIIADTAEKVIKGSVHAAGFHGGTIGVVVRWSIWIFAVVAALLQLGIAVDLIRMVIMGLVAALALAFGLAFGLGGKDHASQFIEKMKRDIHGNM